MATWKPELHNAEDILNYYDQYDDAGYSVYAGHKPDHLIAVLPILDLTKFWEGKNCKKR